MQTCALVIYESLKLLFGTKADWNGVDTAAHFKDSHPPQQPGCLQSVVGEHFLVQDDSWDMPGDHSGGCK